MTWATTLAAQKIEELRSRPVLAAVAGESVDFIDWLGASLDGSGSAPPAYTRRWWIEALPSALADTFVLTVAVSRYQVGDEFLAHTAVAHRDVIRLVTLQTRTDP